MLVQKNKKYYKKVLEIPKKHRNLMISTRKNTEKTTEKTGAWRQNYQLVTPLRILVTALPKCLGWSTRKGLRPFLAHFLKENAAGCGALSFPLIKIALGVVKSKIQRLFFCKLVTPLPILVTPLPKWVW